MARGADLGSLLDHTRRVEAGTITIEAPPPPRRLARPAIPLDVTAGAGLQALPGNDAVPRDEEPRRVMVTLSQRRRGHQPRALVARHAELARVVTGVARRFARVGGSRVATQEPGRMVRPGAGGVGTVALDAVAPAVTARAGLRRGLGAGRVMLDERGGMPRRGVPRDQRTEAAARTGWMECGSHGGSGRVAGETALLGVAGRTGRRGQARRRAVGPQEVLGLVRRGSLEGHRNGRAAGIGRQ